MASVHAHIIIMLLQLFTDHFRGFSQRSYSNCWDSSSTSWLPTVRQAENVWNSLGVSLLQSQESELFLDCQLGYFFVYADWANVTVKHFFRLLTSSTDGVCIQWLRTHMTFSQPNWSALSPFRSRSRWASVDRWHKLWPLLTLYSAHNWWNIWWGLWH